MTGTSRVLYLTLLVTALVVFFVASARNLVLSFGAGLIAMLLWIRLASDKPAWHWRVVTVMVRLCGLAFLLGGVWFVAYALGLLSWLEGEREPLSASQSVLFLIVGLIAALFGGALLRARPYRPDLAKLAEPPDSDVQPSKKRYSWWTGDPRRAA